MSTNWTADPTDDGVQTDTESDDMATEVVAGEGESDEVRWLVADKSHLATHYSPDVEINEITAKVRVGTPQDGTWGVNVTIEADPTGRGLLTTLFPKYLNNHTMEGRKEARYDSRQAAEADAKRLLSNLTTEAILRQFVVGIASQWEDIDSRDLDVIRSALESGA